jgi:hypothetical protein
MTRTEFAHLLRQIIVLSPQNKPPNLGTSCFRPLQLKHGLSSRRGARLRLLQLAAFLFLEPFAKTQHRLRNMILHLVEGNRNASPSRIRGGWSAGSELLQITVVQYCDTLKQAGCWIERGRKRLATLSRGNGGGIEDKEKALEEWRWKSSAFWLWFPASHLLTDTVQATE